MMLWFDMIWYSSCTTNGGNNTIILVGLSLFSRKIWFFFSSFFFRCYRRFSFPCSHFEISTLSRKHRFMGRDLPKVKEVLIHYARLPKKKKKTWHQSIHSFLDFIPVQVWFGKHVLWQRPIIISLSSIWTNLSSFRFFADESRSDSNSVRITQLVWR